ncbi:M15 family metallopeptidase [Streptomyces sp. NPDC057302]|uniref:M15 family metallopeptidase n=1 Tax=Streptomyces sp. NPDC057302 TaxID=3346094 RepID=UPI00363A9F7C
MNENPPSARIQPRRIRRRIVAGSVVALIAAIAATFAWHAQNFRSSASSASELTASPSFSSAPSPPKGPRGEHGGALGEAGGAVPEGTTVFDDDVVAVARLGPNLLNALRQAAKDAAGSGLPLYINSGWRSPQYQDQLLREAISKYGSKAEAARWVATAKTSPHVSGDAVDIGRSNAAKWLSEHGERYGLCQIYRNEPWHYELRSDAIDRGCPQMYADPTQDPRMQK